MSVPLLPRNRADVTIYCSDGEVPIHKVYRDTFFPFFKNSTKKGVKQTGKGKPNTVPFTVRAIYYITDVWYNPKFADVYIATIDSNMSAAIMKALDHMCALKAVRDYLYVHMLNHMIPDNTHTGIACMYNDIVRESGSLWKFFDCVHENTAREILYKITIPFEGVDFVTGMLVAEMYVDRITFRRCPWILYTRITHERFAGALQSMIRIMTAEELNDYCAKVVIDEAETQYFGIPIFVKMLPCVQDSVALYGTTPSIRFFINLCIEYGVETHRNYNSRYYDTDDSDDSDDY